MRYFVFLFSLSLSINLHAQHCPYDGASLIAIKLINQKGKPVSSLKDTLYLVEIDNPQAALCDYADGLLKMPLLNTADYFAWRGKKYGTTYNENLKKRLIEMNVIGNANLLVSLNQAQKDCMIKKGGDYEYRVRKFLISYHSGNKQINIPVPPGAILSLCTGSRDLENFKPIVIKL